MTESASLEPLEALAEEARRIVAGADVAADDAGASLQRARIVGIGWATVELERAAQAFGPPGTWQPAVRDATLGAASWIALGRDRDREPAIVLLEPDTEGRLAAFLVRHGEGVAAVYVALPDTSAAVADHLRLGALAPGPLGFARPLRRGADAPAILVVQQP
jgi:hypothetical protein